MGYQTIYATSVKLHGPVSKKPDSRADGEMSCPQILCPFHCFLFSILKIIDFKSTIYLRKFANCISVKRSLLVLRREKSEEFGLRPELM